MKQARLFTPGPTAVPPEVLETQSRPLLHHRTPEFKKAHLDVIEGLRYIMQTGNPVAVLTASGSGAMEAAVVNMTRPGEKIIVTELGKFSRRWRELGQAFGVEVVSVSAEWGTAVPPEKVQAAFAEHGDAVALFTTHSETSTGVLQDVESFARIAREHDALIAVDGITSIGAHDVRTDEWGLDALVGGSQKSVMIPPGLGYVALSPAAIAKIKKGRHAVHYFDLLAAVDKAESGDTPYTPAITLFLALQKALQMMRKEGLSNIVARHAANAAAVRAAVRAIGLQLFTRTPSNATTAVVAPDGRASDITRTMENGYGIKIAGGQDHLLGKIFRLGHLGYYTAEDMKTMITALEATLSDLKLADNCGVGVAALQESFAGGVAQ